MRAAHGARALSPVSFSKAPSLRGQVSDHNRQLRSTGSGHSPSRRAYENAPMPCNRARTGGFGCSMSTQRGGVNLGSKRDRAGEDGVSDEIRFQMASPEMPITTALEFPDREIDFARSTRYASQRASQPDPGRC